MMEYHHYVCVRPGTDIAPPNGVGQTEAKRQITKKGLTVNSNTVVLGA